MSEPVVLGGVALEGLIGSGGGGHVWRGRHVVEGVAVAVKVLSARHAKSRAVREAFAHEVRALARLNHPAICTVYDLGEVDVEAARRSRGDLVTGVPYLVMELATGGSLADPERGPGSWEELRTLLGAVLDALSHSHARGVLHRDLKPANLLLRGGEDARSGPMVADFGIASALGAAPVRGTEGAGTPRYAPPEQRLGLWRSFGPWTDLYALAATTWSLVCGEPYKGGPFVPRFAVPAGLEGWLLRALSSDPADRYRSAAQALAALPDGAGAIQHRWQLTAPELAVGLPLFALREPEVLGRTEPRRKLRRAARTCFSEKRPVVVEIEGPSGVGRSTLLRWLTQVVQERGVARVLWLDDADADGAARALERLLPGSEGESLPHPHWRDVGPELAEAVAAWSAEAASETSPASPSSSSRTTHIFPELGLLGRVAERLTRAHPLVVAVDDADTQAGLAPLVRVLARVSGPVLLVCVGRARGFPKAEVTVRIRRQTADQLARILDGLLPLEPATAIRLAGASGGRVAYARSLLAHHVSTGTVVRRAGRWSLVGGAPMASATERDLIERAVPSVPGRRALSVLAALGAVVPQSLWREGCEALGLSAEDQAEAMAGLLDAAVVQVRDGELVFDRPAVREAALEVMLAQGWAREIHGACAAVVGEPGDSPEAAFRLGVHLRRAGHDALATPVLRASADGFYTAARWDRVLEVVEELERCAGLSTPLRLWARLRRGIAYVNLGSLHEGLQETLDLEPRAREAGDQDALVGLLRLRAVAYMRLGRDADAAVVGRQAVEAARGHPREADVLLTMCHTIKAFGGYPVEQVARTALQMAETAGNASTAAWARHVLASHLMGLGRLDEAAEFAALVVADPVIDPTTFRSAHSVLGDVAHLQGRLDDAQRHYEIVVADASPFVESGEALAVGQINLAFLALVRGRNREARRWLQVIRETFGSVPIAVRSVVDLVTAAVATRLGDRDECLRRLERVRADLDNPALWQLDTLRLLDICGEGLDPDGPDALARAIAAIAEPVRAWLDAERSGSARVPPGSS